MLFPMPWSSFCVDFVLGLQEGFKSTVPNILRTCEKLKLPSKPKPQDQQKQDGKPATVGPKDNPAVPVMTATQTEKVCCLCGRYCRVVHAFCSIVILTLLC